MWAAGQRHAPADLPPAKRPGTHYTGGWMHIGQVWTDAEYLAPAEIRSPGCPACNESQYRQGYPGPLSLLWWNVKIQYHVHKTLILHPLLSHLDPAHTASCPTYV